MIIKLANLWDTVKENRIKLTSEEKQQAGKARVLKFSDKGKIKYAVHEQPALMVSNTISKAVKNFNMLVGK